MIKKILIKSKFIRLATLTVRKMIERLIFRCQGYGKDIEKYKNIYENQPLLIVGNGPSLNETPLDLFSGIPSIGMNKINLLFDKVKWRPTFIICTNGVVMEQNKEFFENSTIPILLEFKAFLLKVRGKSIKYFNTMNQLNFSNDFTKPIGGGPTVTYQALQFAYYLGANPIIIIGVDHSFKVTKGDKISYQKNESDDVNHFDPNYFGKGSLWGVPDLDQSEIVYQFAKEAFEKSGRQIFDATINGKLNIFKKITINEALNLLTNDND